MMSATKKQPPAGVAATPTATPPPATKPAPAPDPDGPCPKCGRKGRPPGHD